MNKYLSHCMLLRSPSRNNSKRKLLKNKSLPISRQNNTNRYMHVNHLLFHKSKTNWLWYLTPTKKKKVKMFTKTVFLGVELHDRTLVYPEINRVIKEAKVWRSLEVSIVKAALRTCASQTFWIKILDTNGRKLKLVSKRLLNRRQYLIQRKVKITMSGYQQ